MTYEWDFYTGASDSVVSAQKCHRGPMTDFEIQLSRPFSVLASAEKHRKLVLRYIVDTTAPSVRTRECVLRTINSEIGPLITVLYRDSAALQAPICEKRRATDIEADLVGEALDFDVLLNPMVPYGVQPQQIEIVRNALKSSNPILRVAGKCATIVLATLIEIG